MKWVLKSLSRQGFLFNLCLNCFQRRMQKLPKTMGNPCKKVWTRGINVTFSRPCPFLNPLKAFIPCYRSESIPKSLHTRIPGTLGLELFNDKGRKREKEIINSSPPFPSPPSFGYSEHAKALVSVIFLILHSPTLWFCLSTVINTLLFSIKIWSFSSLNLVDSKSIWKKKA